MGVQIGWLDCRDFILDKVCEWLTTNANDYLVEKEGDILDTYTTLDSNSMIDDLKKDLGIEK